MSGPVHDYCWSCGTEFVRQEGHECPPRNPVRAPFVYHRGEPIGQLPDGAPFPQFCDDEDCKRCSR